MRAVFAIWPVLRTAALVAAGVLVLAACSTTRTEGLLPLGDAGNGARDAPVDAGTRADGERVPPGAKTLAEACSAAAECASGSCVDGVCCEGGCAGACLTCNHPGAVGRCVPVPNGAADPRGLCADEGAASCGLSGRCNGQGACARHPAGTRCRPAACVGPSSLDPGATCDGRGACVSGPAISCDPSPCAAGGCRQGCTGDGDCLPPATCNAGSCGKRGLGQACSMADDCKSRFCADGVCCNDECAGPCRFCALASALGRCLNVPADTPDPRRARGVTDPTAICATNPASSCGSNGLCDGAGGCQLHAPGTPCAPQSCAATANSFRATATCDGEGRCISPAAQSCAPFKCGGDRCATSCAMDADCVAPAVCERGSCGRRPLGQPCAAASDCATGQCAQGVCCATACTGTCRSCALPGSVGTCAPVPSGGADPDGTCRAEAAATCGNDGTCNGAGACRKHVAGTVCSPARCAGGTASAPARCNGSGTCEAAATRDCTPYLCNAATADCFDACSAGGAECATGNQCVLGRCGKKTPGAPCSDAADCQSNFCVDGVCCEGACGGACESCSLAGSAGTCAPVPAGMVDSGCSPTCTAGGAAQDRRCDGARACEVDPSPVACAPYQCRAGRCLTACQADGDCATGNVCSAMTCGSQVRRPLGASCTNGNDCSSGNCVNGTCCSVAACGTCQTCANAAGICVAAPAGAPCGTATCSGDGRSSISSRCSLLGACEADPPVSCGNYLCTAGSCPTRCSMDAECSVGRCRGFMCR